MMCTWKCMLIVHHFAVLLSKSVEWCWRMNEIQRNLCCQWQQERMEFVKSATSYSWVSFLMSFSVNRQYDKIMEFTRQTDNTWQASSQEGLESSICLLQCVSLLHPHTSAIFPLICLTPHCSCRISDVQTLKCEGLTSVILSLAKS